MIKLRVILKFRYRQVNNIIIKKRLRKMNTQPNWLNIEAELYPQIYIHKVIHVQGFPIGTSFDYHTQVIYNSLHRQINITESLSQLISQYFSSSAAYEILILDYESQKFIKIGHYPLKQPIILKGIFVQNQFLFIKLHSTNQLIDTPKAKPKTEKTLKMILQKVAQWRKIQIQSQKKITLEEAANRIGISRNTLNDYYFQIKLAEKYGFNFQQQLDEPFQNLRKFVKENQQKKQKNKTSVPLPHILSKYQSK